LAVVKNMAATIHTAWTITSFVTTILGATSAHHHPHVKALISRVGKMRSKS
jgi:hypothetical protein